MNFLLINLKFKRIIPLCAEIHLKFAKKILIAIMDNAHPPTYPENLVIFVVEQTISMFAMGIILAFLKHLQVEI